MKGLWIWPTDEKDQARIIDHLRGTIMVDILTALSKNKAGLSNAQLDTLMDNSSQWNSLWTMRQLLALGFAEYRVNVFGDSGKYLITELGQGVLNRMTGKPQQSPPAAPPTAQTAAPATPPRPSAPTTTASPTQSMAKAAT